MTKREWQMSLADPRDSLVAKLNEQRGAPGQSARADVIHASSVASDVFKLQDFLFLSFGTQLSNRSPHGRSRFLRNPHTAQGGRCYGRSRTQSIKQLILAIRVTCALPEMGAAVGVVPGVTRHRSFGQNPPSCCKRCGRAPPLRRLSNSLAGTVPVTNDEGTAQTSRVRERDDPP